MSRPIGYFFTWTCYGTWLHGDARGAVDRRHNVYGTPRLDADPARRAAESASLDHDRVSLDEKARHIVAETVRAHCRLRDWDVVALNVRTNHVHLVVTNVAIDPDEALGQLKAWATRRLREGGCVPADTTVWTKHGSTKYLWKDDDVAEAARYVAEGQGNDLP